MIAEAMVAIAALIESLATQYQNETLQDILAWNTVDLLTLTFRAHVLRRHWVAQEIEAVARGCGAWGNRAGSMQASSLLARV
jgi:hypothetical protein